MTMLSINQVEEISAVLIRVPEIVSQQHHAANFSHNVAAWLTTLEAVLAAAHHHVTSSIASLRSGIIAAQQGHIPSGIEIRGRLSRSRISSFVASQALQRASELAATVISENLPRIEECKQVAQQIVALAFSRGLITAFSEGVSKTQYLALIRRNLTGSSDLENAYTRLEGLVGPKDALILLERAISALEVENSSPLMAITLPMPEG